MNNITISPAEENTLLELEESHFIDLKSSRIAPASLQKHFVAFANTDGGEIYVGIEDKKVTGERIIGFDKPESANDIVQVLMTATKPSVEGVDWEFINFGNRGLVLHISVPKSAHLHYTTSDECYIRVNASTKKIIGEAITKLAYAKGTYNYEKVVVPEVDIENITGSAYLASYMERIGTTQESTIFLRKQKLLSKVDESYRPTVGSILLFDEEPQASLNTRCAIKVYRLQTTEREYKREYLKQAPSTIEGPIEQQITQVIQKVQELLQDVEYSVAGKLVKLVYPDETLHEILVNAVIHRDYSVNDDIHVRVYDNRIEVLSPGKLPGYITPRNYLEERYARNPNLVRMLHKLPNPVNHDIGEGLNTASNAMKKAGLVAPVLMELDNAVVLTIEHRRIASLVDIIREYLEDHETVSNKLIREISGEDSENKVKKAFEKLRGNGEIEPVDPDASRFKYEYRKVNRSDNGTSGLGQTVPNSLT
ncbi:RNA-binding domain-containing protein [Leptolyngbya sp. CCNP1308]|uniref:RNA-binding domain-containing protein n=1 Tax=Leptolyngbya sp. CCNP1308 TaxID=3110255 RepID=UPI002B20FD55|nr:RNA-binding domain-containing protein [Leptolyngbya sp. CCNP1308]MEA5450003.1 RNA-binding domain-containing protein [Leptolyngbya sp. CCNP1308]